MTPRELVNQAEEKADRASYDALVDELGTPSGWITVNARPMAYWLPEGVPPLELAEHDEDDGPSPDDANRTHAPDAVWASEGATKNQQVPF